MKLKKEWEPVVGGDAIHGADKVIVKGLDTDSAWVYSNDGYFTVRIKQLRQAQTEEEELISLVDCALYHGQQEVVATARVVEALIKAGYKKC